MKYPREPLRYLDQQDMEKIHAAAGDHELNLRSYSDDSIGVSLDETTSPNDVQTLLEVFCGSSGLPFQVEELLDAVSLDFPEPFHRTSSFLTHEVFHRYHSEHEMLRYINDRTRDSRRLM